MKACPLCVRGAVYRRVVCRPHLFDEPAVAVLYAPGSRLERDGQAEDLSWRILIDEQGGLVYRMSDETFP